MNGTAVSNVGADLMFGFDEANYDDSDTEKQVATHAGILFSRASWNSTTRTIRKDFQITFIRGQILE